jgi:copper chaperone CopZ
VACVFALAADDARAASRQDTVITVSELCSGCVRNIKKRLKELPEVSYVNCNTATKTVTVVPKSGKSLSPRVLWEAMQGVGNPPKKLVDPTGTYTSKPKQ